MVHTAKEMGVQRYRGRAGPQRWSTMVQEIHMKVYPKKLLKYLDQKDGQLLPFPLEGLGERAGLVQAPWVNASIGENISKNDV